MTLLNVHPKIEEALRHSEHGTVIDGALATQAIDTSGEVIDIAGTDISSLNEDGCLNTEHINSDNKDKASFSVIIGRCIFAKKIFSAEDCESERELLLWEKVQLPMIYGAFELFDQEEHENAKSAAAIIKHYHKRGLPVLIKFSIEGTTLDRKGNYLTKTIARRVAATIKPCNKSSISSLVEEAAPPSVGDSIEKSEKYITTNEMEYSLLIEDPQEALVNSFSKFRELTKTLTLGSSNAMPDSLSGGAALSVQDMGQKSKFLKNQVLAAVRDWNGTEDFKKFLKHRLPDLNEEYLDKFGQMADEIRMIKAQNNLNKIEDPDDTLPPLQNKAPKQAIKFKGKHVIPGEAEIKAGPFQGSKIKVFHVDDNYAYVEPFKSGGGNDVKVNKLNRKLEGSHFIINKDPEILSNPTYLEGHRHTDLGLTHTNEQKRLIHGINTSIEPLDNPLQSSDARGKGNVLKGYYQNSAGDSVLLKPAINYEFDELQPGMPEHLSTAKREAVFHNVARDFFGLGDSVPTTTVFNHPDTGLEHSAMKFVPNSIHIHSDSYGPERHVLSLNGDSGKIDKLAIMDSLMGSSDRNRFNYLVGKDDKNVHLIDNALIFNYGNDRKIPQYLLDYHEGKSSPWNNAEMHPETLDWLKQLDPAKFEQTLERNGVHKNIINKAVSRLISMQSEALFGKTKANDILFAHDRYIKKSEQEMQHPIPVSKLNGSYRIYRIFKVPSKTKPLISRLMARVYVKNHKFYVLEDHDNLVSDVLPEGPVSEQHSRFLWKLQSSGYYHVICDQHINEGLHENVIEDLDIGNVKPEARYVYHEENSRPQVLEMFGESGALNGKAINKEQLTKMMKMVKSGMAKLEAL